MLLCLLEMDSLSVEVYHSFYYLLLLGLVGKEQNNSGFFMAGKYSDQPSPSDEWLKQGKWVGKKVSF